MNNIKQKNCWPNFQQELLLQASLIKGEKALQAWARWKAITDINKLESNSLRLLPLLYQNLVAHNVADPWLKHCKRIYFQTKIQNQYLLHNVQPLLKIFRENDIEILFLKGMALLLMYYQDYGLRPMQDFDVLVPFNEAKKSIEILINFGWKPHPHFHHEKFNEAYFNIRHAHAFKNEDNIQELDLHWHILAEGCHNGDDPNFRHQPERIQIDDMFIYALNPTQQLFHVCIHGLRWSLTPSLHWIADAMVVINNSPNKIDWEILITQAEKYHVVLRLREALNYLHTKFDAKIPTAIIDKLHNMPINAFEFKEYQFNINVPKSNLLYSVKSMWFQYRRNTQAIGWLPRIINFPQYLRTFWGIDSSWQLPFYVTKKLMQNFRRSYNE